MDFQVKYSKQAAQDISDIVEYISGILCNPVAAEHFYDEVNKKLQRIRKNPFMYPLSRDKKLNAEGYRAVVIKNYLLFYFIDEINMVAYIARIVCGRRDFIPLIQDADDVKGEVADQNIRRDD